MLLAVDTSTRTVGVALYDGSQVLSESVWTSRDYHTVELAPAVARVLARAGIAVANLQALAVATGPGSFTGLRVGLALVKGLSLAAHLPVLGIPSLDVLAEAQPVKVRRLCYPAGGARAARGRLVPGQLRKVAAHRPGRSASPGCALSEAHRAHPGLRRINCGGAPFAGSETQERRPGLPGLIAEAAFLPGRNCLAALGGRAGG